ncbi:hypothetical protein, partial [Aurantimonas coralicida]|uniref:hypothetical protein n=1 Tax=Aurantimonas coralicida TaxID=182270 RepID=UPI00239AE1F4
MRTRFLIDVCGQPRALFSVREIRNRQDPAFTDLNIHFSGGGRSKPGKDLSELLLPGNEDAYRQADTHFSVHANPCRPLTNTITRRLTLRGDGKGTETGSILISTGIKSGLIVPILFRICGDLSSVRFDVRDDATDQISLGSFDPSRDQLRFMVAV